MRITTNSNSRLLLHSVLIALVGLLGFLACKRSRPDLVLAQEQQIVNSRDSLQFLPGVYKAVELILPNGTREGRDYDLVPTTIRGNYTLSIERQGTDSLALYLNGSGSGATYDRVNLGTFAIDRETTTIGTTVFWYLNDRYPRRQHEKVAIDRVRQSSTTPLYFSCEIDLIQVTDSKAADYGKLYVYTPGIIDRSARVAYFRFRRTSTATLL